MRALIAPVFIWVCSIIITANIINKQNLNYLTYKRSKLEIINSYSYYYYKYIVITLQ